MNEKVDMKEGCARLSFLFVVTKWQDNNVIYIVYYVQILNLCMMGAKGVHITCLNTGHDGSLSTGHANSPKDMLSRLESMVLMGMDLPLGAVQRQIASGIDIIVHLGRLRDKSRKVLEVSEILDYQDGEILVSPLYRFEETGEKDGKIQGTWRKMDDLVHTQKLLAAGYKEV